MNKLGNPFHPKNGKFAGNIRDITGDDLSELKASISEFGFLKEFPVIQDENGVTIVGARRLKAANELGVKPTVITMNFGNGEEADAKRLRLALASNLGTKLMTKEDRQRIAEYLYGEREWTMERIAQALNVTKGTVSKDLQGIVSIGNKSKLAKTASNPKGAGRPKGSKKSPPKPHPKAEQIIALADKGMSYRDIAVETGISSRQVRHIVEEEQLVRKGRSEPIIDPDALPKSSKEKLTIAIRQHVRKLDLEFEQRVRDETVKRLEEFYLPDLNKQLADAEATIKARKGVMSRADFRKILACLHPDRSMSDKKLSEAFQLFESLELVLCSEKEMPTESKRFPNSFADMMKNAKRKTR